MMSELASNAQNPQGMLDSAQARHLMVLSKRAVEGQDGVLEITGKLDCIGEAILKIAEGEDGEEPQSLYDVYLETAPDPRLNATTLVELVGYGTTSYAQLNGEPQVNPDPAA
jgi:hypothetical protein